MDLSVPNTSTLSQKTGKHKVHDTMPVCDHWSQGLFEGPLQLEGNRETVKGGALYSGLKGQSAHHQGRPNSF